MLGPHICMGTIGIPGGSGGQKKAPDPLKLELWMIVSHHVDAGNQSWVLCKTSTLNHLALPTPRGGFSSHGCEFQNTVACWENCSITPPWNPVRQTLCFPTGITEIKFTHRTHRESHMKRTHRKSHHQTMGLVALSILCNLHNHSQL